MGNLKDRKRILNLARQTNSRSGPAFEKTRHAGRQVDLVPERETGRKASGPK
jgi:hypothetical protein